MERGFVLTVDYGRPAAELYSPELRRRGTLTTYYRHAQLDAPLQHVGRQDITAQVDFTSVIDAGRRNGLDLLGLDTQGRFLRRLGLTRMQQRLAALDLPQYAAQANRAGMLDLARQGGLGDFKVLCQGKGVGAPELWGFTPSAEAAESGRPASGAPVDRPTTCRCWRDATPRRRPSGRSTSLTWTP